MVVLVCRRWREVGEAPVLWASLLLTLGEANYRCLGAARLVGLRRVTVTSVAPEVLGAVLAHPGLTRVTLEPTLILGDADPALLGNLVARMEGVEMAKVADKRLKCMNYSQLKIFSSLISKSTSLKALNMNNRNLAGVAPPLLADILSGLVEANFRDVELTEAQANMVCSRLAEGNRLETLVLSSNKLEGVPAEDLARAVRGVSSLNLANTKLTPLQTITLFKYLDKSSSIKELTIGLNNLGAVEARTIASVIGKLRVVQVREGGVTTEQWTAIFTTISTLPAKGLEADFSNNSLAKVSHALLSAAVVKMEKVKLMSTKLTKTQSSAIINSICHNYEEIKELNIMFNNLSSVDPVYLAIAARKLVRLNLGWTRLKTAHLENIFERLSQQDVKLQELRLSGIDMRHVEAKVLARVINKLSKADLNFTHLQAHQLMAIFCKMKEKTKLKELVLSSNDVSEVDSKSIGDAVQKLEVVNLCETSLTSRQAMAILNHSKKFTKLKSIDLRKNKLEVDMDEENFTVVKNSDKKVNVMF